MTDELFSEDLASISELSDRWNVQLHQITYIVRARKIPCERVAGTTRLFSKSQQQAIYAVLHKYLPIEGSLILAPPIAELTEQEALQQDQLIQEVETLKAKNAVLEAEVASVKADVALLKRLMLQEQPRD